MRNRITNHCKTIRHLTLLSWLICCLVANIALAKSQSINVYLKLRLNNQVKTLVKELNQFLTQQGIFSTYQITPYLNQHPLHITLYLADYDSQQIPSIIKQTKILAEQKKPITFFTAEFITNSNAYVMLSVMRNEQMQELSNEVLHTLANLRDKKASIPAWAAKDLKRQALFRHYGSPNVLNYFNPHFSIFSADHLNKKQNARLYQQLQDLIAQYTQHHQTQMQATAYALGVGLADPQGQIVEELGSFPMKNKSTYLTH